MTVSQLSPQITLISFILFFKYFHLVLFLCLIAVSWSVTESLTGRQMIGWQAPPQYNSVKWDRLLWYSSDWNFVVLLSQNTKYNLRGAPPPPKKKIPYLTYSMLDQLHANVLHFSWCWLMHVTAFGLYRSFKRIKSWIVKCIRWPKASAHRVTGQFPLYYLPSACLIH